MRRIDIILLVLALILFAVVVGSYLLIGKTPQTQPSPVVYFSPSPTPALSLLPPDLEKERVEQENYAKARQEFINQKPWVIRLPLKTEDYFVTYDPDSDIILVKLYYSSDDVTVKQRQLTQAKNRVLRAMTEIGVDTSQQKIEYMEKKI